PGTSYLATVWVKVDSLQDATGVSLGLRLRAKNNWHPVSATSVKVVASESSVGEWQPLFVNITLPKDADGLSFQLGVTRSSAVFSNPELKELPISALR